MIILIISCILIFVLFEIKVIYSRKQKNKLFKLRLNHIRNIEYIKKIFNSCISYDQIVKTYIWSCGYLRRYFAIDPNYNWRLQDRSLLDNLRSTNINRIKLVKINSEQLLSLNKLVSIRDSNIRLGQAYFNELYSMNPYLAEFIRGTEYDPFYDDSRIDKFLNYIKQ